MKPTKKQKAEYLFDEIGNVSDVFLSEALTYRAPMKQQVKWKLPVSIAAALLVLFMTLPLLLRSVLPGIGTNHDSTADGMQDGPGTNNVLDGNTGNNAGDAPPASGETVSPTDDPIYGSSGGTTDAQPLTLETLLFESRENAYATVMPSEVDYFDKPYLLWQIQGDETIYRSRDLTSAELNRMIALIREGKPVESSMPQTTLSRVYLVVGNGDVLTPYLPATTGNIGASLLFDYNAELIPSQNLISFLSDILK